MTQNGRCALQVIPVEAKLSVPCSLNSTATRMLEGGSGQAKSDITPAAAVPKKAHVASASPPVRQKRAAHDSENAVSGRRIPAYMKPTASVKAKDAREQQAKIAASRTALAEKKWNRT